MDKYYLTGEFKGVKGNYSGTNNNFLDQPELTRKLQGPIITNRGIQRSKKELSRDQ